jgi:phosphatidylglycerophosphate synthase
MVTWTGFVIGMGAAASIAAGWFTAGLVMILANRMCDGLDGAVARASRPSDVGGFLDITLDFIFYSAIPFAFCVNDTQHALAGAFLIFSFVGSGSSFLAFAIIAQKRGISTDQRGKKSFFYLGGLTEGTETIIFLIIASLMPTYFGVLAWIFGSLCWVTTVTRIRTSLEMLQAHQAETTGDDE